MQLIRFDPFRDLQKMERDLDQAWGNGGGLAPTATTQVVTDLYTEEGALVAEVAMPYFSKDDIQVRVDEGSLEITAERSDKEEKNKRRYYFRESRKQYLRWIALPQSVAVDKVQASFDNHVLKVIMPIVSPKESKEVAVK